jgi:hypothetical protein
MLRKMIVIGLPSSSGSWVRAANGDTENQANSQRALDYPSRRYLDNPDAEESNQPGNGEHSSLRDTQQEWATERTEG